MCIATIYKNNTGSIEQIFQEVVSMDIENSNINMTTILGERKTLEGIVKHIDFLKHTVIIEPVK